MGSCLSTPSSQGAEERGSSAAPPRPSSPSRLSSTCSRPGSALPARGCSKPELSPPSSPQRFLSLPPLLRSHSSSLPGVPKPGWSKLHTAVSRGDEEALRRLCAHIGAAGVDGNTPLHLAAKLGQDAAIKILLAAGANPAPLNSEHQCPLHLAALHGQEVAARLLLAAAPASAGVHDAAGNLALHYAAEMGHLAIVRLLTASRRGLDERNLQGETALHLAAAAGHHFCAEQLDKAGAHSLPDALRRTPLMHAAAAGHTAAVQALLDSGAAAVDAGDSEGATALLMAAQAGAADTVAALLAGGATADAAGRQGIAPVHAAAAAGHEAVMRVLAAHGAWLNAWAGGRGDQPLHLAAAAGHEAVIRALLDCSADPRAINADGCTAVHTAAAAGQATCLELLLGGMGGGSNGCSSWLVDAADNQGRTALHHAVAGGHLAAVECLLGAGASIHAQDASGATPVEQALAAHGGGPEAQAIKERLLQAAAAPADPGAAQEQVPLPPPPHHVRCKPSAPPAQAQDLGTCCYCLSSQCDTAFAPCGHRACCRRCAEVLLAAPEAGRLCPVCRDQVAASLTLCAP